MHLCRLCGRWRPRLPDLIELLLQRQLAQLVDGEADKDADPIAQHAQSVGKGEGSLCISTFSFHWIGEPPMRGHRLARPDRTDLLRRVVADGENEAAARRVRRIYPTTSSAI